MENNIGDRVFYGTDNVTKYYIVQPSADDIREADWQYSKTYTKCLVEGIMTSNEMMDLLVLRNIIGPEFEQRAKELSDTLNTKIESLSTATDMDEKRILAMEVFECRDELFKWNQRLNGPMSNTCEQISDDARIECLTSSMVLDSAGKRVWASYSDFLSAEDSNLASKARFEVMLYFQGMDSDFMDKTPEAMAMREVEQDIVIKAQELLDAIKEEPEVEEKPKASKKPSKKTTKKTTKKTDEKTNV